MTMIVMLPAVPEDTTLWVDTPHEQQSGTIIDLITLLNPSGGVYQNLIQLQPGLGYTGT